MINRKITTAMAMACLAGTCFYSNMYAAETEITPVHYELEQAGTVTDEERTADEPFLLAEGTTLPEDITDTEYLDNGTFTVTTALTRENPNTTGLFTSDGEQLLAPEYAMIKEPSNKKDGSGRFLCVAKTTGETTSEDDAFMYVTSRMIAVTADEDDILYTGTAQVYDQQEQKIVDGVEFNATSMNDGFFDLGDAFAVEDKAAGSVTVYSAAGEVLYEMDGYYPDAGLSTIQIHGTDGYRVIDSAGNEVLSSGRSIDLIDPDHDLYSIANSGDDGSTYYSIVDKSGNTLIEKTPSMPYSSESGFIEYKQDNTYILADHDGNTVADHIKSVSADFHGYVDLKLLNDSNETSGVITPAGVITDLKCVDMQGDLVYSKDGNLLVLNTGEASLGFAEDAQIDALKEGLVKVGLQEDGATTYGVYDLFTGDQLLDNVYDSILLRGDHLFARRENEKEEYVWEVYHLSLVE